MQMKGQGCTGTFELAGKRSVAYVLQFVGYKPIDAYCRTLSPTGAG